MMPGVIQVIVDGRVSSPAARERLIRLLDCGQGLYDHLPAGLTGALGLVTCERVEWLLETQRGVERLLQDWPAPVGPLLANARWQLGRDAAVHLLRVAAGLESRIVGEPHVLGQVREAYGRSLTLNRCSATLSALAMAAIRTGRRVRHETCLNAGAVSLATRAVDWLVGHMGCLPDSLVILGTGAMARELTRLVVSSGCRPTVVSRNKDRAQSFAGETGTAWATIDSLKALLASSSALLTAATAQSGPLVTEKVLRGARSDRSLAIVDLGVPHNVEESVHSLPGVELVDLTELPGSRGDVAAVCRAEEIVDEEFGRFAAWCDGRSRIGEIVGLIGSGGGRSGSASLHRRIQRLKSGAAA